MVFDESIRIPVLSYLFSERDLVTTEVLNIFFMSIRWWHKLQNENIYYLIKWDILLISLQFCKNVEKVMPYPYRIAMFPKDS